MPARTSEARALTELILEVFRLNGRLLAAGDTITGGVGQSSARWQVLGSLASEERSVAEVARRVGRARQSVRETASRLIADGMVEAFDNPADRRAQLLRLTTQGHEVLHAIGPRQRTWANKLARQFNLKDLDTCLTVLRDLGDRLSEQENDG